MLSMDLVRISNDIVRVSKGGGWVHGCMDGWMGALMDCAWMVGSNDRLINGSMHPID